jgi:hypothetical protein
VTGERRLSPLEYRRKETNRLMFYTNNYDTITILKSKTCTTPVEPTSARRGELLAELRHRSERMARESTSGTSIPHDSPAAKARPHTLGLAAVPVTAGFLSQDPAEAAHVPSRSRTEPIRCDCRSRVPSRSRFLGNAPGNPSLPFEDRARRFAWPARGTERFLGRDVFQIPP